ncbi:SDR family NAD(P)-dependent oxidoreductase [Bacillus sp. NP157]|nr:SDR family NAD(P)-dependent oxidoreductase [Bacillus sp. NP157]
MSVLPSAVLPEGWSPAPGVLAGRVYVVTGATGGLGGETARAIVRAGGTVVITGRKVRLLERFHDELVALGGTQPVIHPLDLESATPNDFAALADGLEQEFGRLDGLVHAAAHFNELTPLAMHKPDDWLRAMQVNVSAPFALTQACMPLLGRADDSAVVFVLDDPDRVSRAHWGGYGVSKAAVERMAAVMHAEHKGGAMRVHALLPPPMRTALRRAAYYGENTMEKPLPTASAEAIVYLLSGAGADARGTVLDIRPTH